MILILTVALPNATLLLAGLAAAPVIGAWVPPMISHRDYKDEGGKASVGKGFLLTE